MVDRGEGQRCDHVPCPRRPLERATSAHDGPDLVNGRSNGRSHPQTGGGPIRNLRNGRPNGRSRREVRRGPCWCSTTPGGSPMAQILRNPEQRVVVDRRLPVGTTSADALVSHLTRYCCRRPTSTACSILGFDADDRPRGSPRARSHGAHRPARRTHTPPGAARRSVQPRPPIGRDDDAVDDVLAIAWERIRTYPSCRPGSVSGNVLLDVRKRYRRQHQLLCDRPPTTSSRSSRQPRTTCSASRSSRTSSLPARSRGSVE
jgi:hypothetical protein